MKEYMPTYEQFIFEGKYDKLTGLLTKKVFSFLKIGYALFSMGAIDKLGKKDKEGFYGILVTDDVAMFDVEVFLRFKFDDSVLGSGYLFDGGAWNSPDEDASIEVTLTLNPNKIPRLYNQLNSDIQDVIRHELEHLTQGGENKKPNKAKPTRVSTRNKISVEKGNVYKYFILRDEIPAMCHGLYRKAKIAKIPLDQAFDENLDTLVNSDLISEKEKLIILKKWFEFSLKNLPAAQYTEKYTKILDKLRKK